MAAPRRCAVVEIQTRRGAQIHGFSRKLEVVPWKEGDSGDKGTGWRSAMGGGFLATIFGGGDTRPRCPPSGGNPSNLAGKRVDTEEDVLHLTNLPTFDGLLRPSESELLLTYLTARYLRIPLVLRHFADPQRVRALGHADIQGVLDACFFEPGPWQPPGSVVVPAEVPAPRARTWPPRGSSPARVIQRAGAARRRRRGDFSPLARARHGTTRRARLRRAALRRQAHDAHARVRSVSPGGERVGPRGGRRGGREDERKERRRRRRSLGRLSRTGRLGGRIRRERRAVSSAAARPLRTPPRAFEARSTIAFVPRFDDGSPPPSRTVPRKRRVCFTRTWRTCTGQPRRRRSIAGARRRFSPRRRTSSSTIPSSTPRTPTPNCAKTRATRDSWTRG